MDHPHRRDADAPVLPILAGRPVQRGPVGSTAFIWPTGNHYLSGNDYWSGHLGIDIAAGLGAPVWAADAGVVTIAQGGWNGGYGNVVMIDHGNGWMTVYGHLSQINVVRLPGCVARAGDWPGRQHGQLDRCAFTFRNPL